MNFFLYSFTNYKNRMKKLSTNERIKFLQAFVRKWHKRWHKRHPDNITGFKIAKKKIGGKESTNYSIIFQVKKKKKFNKLDRKNIIPSSIRIRFPDGVIREIKTDIEEAGVLKLQQGITSEVNSVYSKNFGTAGLFVTDSSGRVFMLTNYHVV